MAVRGDGLLVIAKSWTQPGANLHVAYPGGMTRRITNDLNNYRDLSVTSDGRTMIAVQAEEKQISRSLPRRHRSRDANH